MHECNGFTPLIASCRYGHLSMAKRLVERGASIDGHSRITPLCAASEGGHWEVVQWLLDNGADENWRGSSDMDEPTAVLRAAVANGRVQLTRFYLSRGADAEVRRAAAERRVESQQHNYMHQMCMSMGHSNLHEAAKEGHADVVSVLIAFGANVDHTDAMQHTPLFGAVRNGHVDTVCRLLDSGALATARNHASETPLHFAAASRAADKDAALAITRNLIEFGADVNVCAQV